MNPHQQQQDVTGQMRQRSVALLVFAPTPINFPTIDCELFVVPDTLGVLFWQEVVCLLEVGHFALQFIDLAARSRLSPIKAACIQEKGATYLLILHIHCGGRQQRVNAPIRS